MFDLHTHTVFSDGELIPSELVRRMAQKGNRGVAITDHVDFSNLSTVMSSLRRLMDVRDDYEIEVLLGVEITHVPPKLIGRAVEEALKEGAEIVVVHGETPVEPVKPGTNEAAVNEEVDVLAHPGLIDERIAEIAKENGVFLEISARKGHCLANGHVARVAERVGCELVVCSDAHSPQDLIDAETAVKVIKGAGIYDYESVLRNCERVFRRCLRRKRF